MMTEQVQRLEKNRRREKNELESMYVEIRHVIWGRCGLFCFSYYVSDLEVVFVSDGMWFRCP